MTLTKQSLPQLKYATDIFRQQLPSIKLKSGLETARLSHLFYISVGMVLNANEKHHKGEFTIDDLLADEKDEDHTAPFAGSKDVDEFGIRRVRFLEYGPETRVPSQVRRPTFPELYDRDKLMVAEFGGFALDDGKWHTSGHLKCNHSVFILMPWHLLKKVNNRSIEDDLKLLVPLSRKQLESASKKIDLWYVLGFLNSDANDALMTGVARSAIANRRQPDDLRQILLPIPDNKIINAVADEAKLAAKAQKALLEFRKNGWRIETSDVTPPGKLPKGIKPQTFSLARVSWGVKLHLPATKVGTLCVNGTSVFKGKQLVMSFPEETSPDALVWLVHQLNCLPQGTTIEAAEHEGIQIPASPVEGVKAQKEVASKADEIVTLLKQVRDSKERISATLNALFEPVDHPPLVGVPDATVSIANSSE